MHKVLVVDDDKLIHSIARRALEGEYDIVDAFDGAQGIEMAISEKPEVILLDVEMPGMNGYEVCDRLKNNDETCEIPVIFVSSLSGVRERMQGYEVGAADFVVKPYEAADLLAKMQVLVQYREEQSRLKEKYQEAHKTALTALSGSGELGQVMLFVESSFEAESYVALAENIFTVTKRLGLQTIVMIKSSCGEKWFSDTGAVSPLEKQLVAMLKDKERIYDFGCRSQINYPKISLLIRNMPLDDMEKYGRYKDLLPPMLSIADAKIRNLDTADTIHQQAKRLDQTLVNIEETVIQLTTMLQDSQTQSSKVMSDMFTELTISLLGMGLDEDQEEQILNRIESAILESDAIVDASHEVKEIFNSVLDELKQLVATQNNMVNDILIKPQSDSSNDDDGSLMDVELF